MGPGSHVGDLHPRWPLSADIVLTWEKCLKKIPLKPVSQFNANMAWMVLKWSIFKIVSGDPMFALSWLTGFRGGF
jgi:hypothetical protein